MMETSITKVYKDNKAAQVGADIICPVCGRIFRKVQYSQAFCSGTCKDAFHNAQGDRHNAPRKLDTLGMLEALTAAGVMFRITNLEIDGLDQNNNVTYRPKVHITLGIRGSEKYHFIGDSLTEEIARAYETAQAEGYLKTESHA